MINPHHSHPEGNSNNHISNADTQHSRRIAPYKNEPHEALATPSTMNREMFLADSLTSSEHRLEVYPGRYVSDGRLFSVYQSRDQHFFIPATTQALILDFDGTSAPLDLTEGIRQKAFRKVILEALTQHFAAMDPSRRVTREDIDMADRGYRSSSKASLLF